MIGRPVDGHDLRRRERLAEVAVGLRLAVGIQILEIHRPGRAPHRLAGVLVEGDDELMVAAIEVHQ